MATCKDCLHVEACSGYLPTDLDKDVWDLCREGRADEIPDIEERCSIFKDRSRFIELPCKIGDSAWGIKKFNNGAERVLQGIVYQMFFGEDMRLCICVRGICRGEWGKKVFATKEEAEKELED